MRPSWRRFALFFFLAFNAVTLHPADKILGAPITLKQLPHTDTLEIRYLVNGCFNFTAYSLRFTADKVEISELRVSEVPPLALVPKPIGSLQLAQADIQGLDRMLNHFRLPNRILSTSSVSLHLKQFRQGKLVREEKIDHVEDDKPAPVNIVRIHTLIERLHGLKDVPSS